MLLLVSFFLKKGNYSCHKIFFLSFSAAGTADRTYFITTPMGIIGDKAATTGATTASFSWPSSLLKEVHQSSSSKSRRCIPLQEFDTGNDIALPQLEQRPILLGYFSLMLAWTQVFWLAFSIYAGMTAEYSAKVSAYSGFGGQMYLALWASIAPHLLFFCGYGVWLGWKFFKHN